MMRRLRSIEIVGLILAAVLVVGGLLCVFYPQQGAFQYDSGRYTGPAAVAYRTKTDVRVCGAFAVLFGIGFGALVLPKRDR